MSVPTRGRWPVVLAGRARGELRLLAEDKNTFDIVRKKFRELSHGQFTKDNCLPVRGSTQYIPIYRARLSNDLRIIYLIDLESDGYNEYDHQIIRILSVSSRARIAYDFWVKVSKFLRRRGSEYRSRCIRREVLNTKDGPLRVPASFPHKAYIPLTVPHPSEGDDPEWEDSDMNELHEAVVLEKYIPVTKSLYNSILADMDAVLPIILNPDEKAIVRYQGTSVVIGRSGTGKTTALVYKMRANAQVAQASDSADSLRQLFVTRSPVLTRRVASYYNALIESGEIANKTPEELQIMRQLNQEYQPRDLLEFDNEADLRDDLPDRYSELTGGHFPLFISFDKLAQLLEADALGTNDALTLARVRLKRLVDFNLFKHQYWPKFDYNLTRRLDPALVFSEIMGVIKGYGHDLSEDEYTNNLTSKKSPLLADVRRQVYAIFKAYKKRCKIRGETDSADRARSILSVRKDVVDIGNRVDYLFMDEVQDQLMAEIYLLHSLCSNPNGGYWCGDTAQTINVGSSFRIRDLKAYLYEKMVPHANAVLNSFQHKIPAPFSTFELTVNFRSHNGIVQYAASLVQILYTLFPGSIDHMQPESAPIPGPKPLVFVNSSGDQDLFAKYLLNRKPLDEAPPFGPEQAIIVRSEETARSLRTRLQNRCNILTLFESKGLEFDDLILYDFFSESDVSDSAWRKIAILESYEENGATQFIRPLDGVSISPGLCSELKQLYVAVTRARHRCWLWDSGSVATMMMNFWQSLGLVKLADSMDHLCLFAGSSGDPRQWAQRGEELFANGLYAIAKTCFERAGREKEAQIADAYSHMSEAGKLQEDAPTAESAYLVAAQKMVTCTELHSAHSTATLWYHAATCFEAAKKIPQASQAYLAGRFYDRAVLILFDAQDMPGCLKVIQSCSQYIDKALLRRIKEVASVHFLRQQDYRRMQLLLDGNLEECIELARSLKFKPQLKDLLKLGHCFEDLAAEYFNDGLPVEAVNCLIHQSKTPSAIQRAREIISIFMWTSFGLGTTSDSTASGEASLLIKICNSQDSLLDSEGAQDMTIFDAVTSCDQVSLALFTNIIEQLDPKSGAYSSRMTTLQYHVLKGNYWTSYHFDDFMNYLEIWGAYSVGLQNLRTLKYPSQDPSIRRLFGLSGISATDASTLVVPNRSQLSDLLNKSLVKNKSQEKTRQLGVKVHTGDVDAHIQNFFASQARKEIFSLSSSLLGSYQAQFVPTSPHDTDKNIPQSISLILSTLDSVMTREHNSDGSVFTSADEEKIRITWSMRLFSLVFLPNGSVGVLKNYQSMNIAGVSGISMHLWINKLLQLLDPWEQDRAFVTLFIACVALAFEFQSTGACPATALPLRIKKNGRPMRRGCPKEPDRFTDDIVKFFQRHSEWRIVNMNKCLKRMVHDSWCIDIYVLIQLIEQMTREVILSEQATTLRSYGGFSGLIAPRSWAMNLVMHSTHIGHAHALKPHSLCEFVGCMEQISSQITDRIPEYWNSPIPHNGTFKCHSGVVILRLFWAILFILVNLHSSHESTRYIQDVLVKLITQIIEFEDTFREGFQFLGFSMSCLPAITAVDRISVLSNIHRVYRQEDVVMLRRGKLNTHSDTSSFTGNIIEFNTLTELHVTLTHASDSKQDPKDRREDLESSSKPVATVDSYEQEEPNIHTIGQNSTTDLPGAPQSDQLGESGNIPIDSVTLPTRPDTPVSIANSEVEELLENHGAKPKMSHEDAALLILRAWRRSLNREEQKQRLSDFDPAGRMYQQYHPYFPRCGAKASERDKLGLRLIRGPCIEIAIGLRAISEEIDIYSEILNDDIHAPGLTLAQVASTQESIKERRKKAEGYKQKVLACCPLDAPAKVLIAKNLAGVKTQTKNAWDAFMVVKNSGILQQSEGFKKAAALVSRGRDLILDATKL